MCLNCDNKSNKEKESHTSISHRRDLSCNDCNHGNTNQNESSSHKERIHALKIYACVKCKFEAQSKTNLESHMSSEHPAVAYPCNSCSYKAIHSRDYERHQATMHTMLSCNKCEFESNDRNKLATHTTNVHPLYPCDICSYKAIHSRDKQRHQNTMHGIKYKCKVCEEEVNDLYNLSTHMREAHRPSRIFHSTTRSNTLNQQTGRQRETILPTSSASISSNTSTEPDLYCDKCTSTFYNRDEFDLHMKFYHEQQ